MKTLTPIRKTLQQHWLKVFWLAPLLVVAGLSAAVVSGWGAIPIGLVISGLVLLALWFLFYSSATPGFWGRRSTRTSTNALVATVSVLVILALINFLGVRYSQRLDLTENQLFTLAPQTQQVVKDLSRPVKALVFVKQPDPASRALLDRYRQLGNQFSFEFVDPDAQPNLARTFNVQDFGDVYLEAGDRRQFVQNTQFERLSESKLTNGLQQLSNTQQSKVYFLQGHGEHPLEGGQRGSLSQASALLTEKNFTSEPLNLVEKREVPADASVVIVAGPKQGLFEAEVTALKDYVNRGGSLLLLLDPNTKPGLDPLLQDWGVTLDDRVVINASERQVANLGAAAPVVNQYGDHPITKDFGNRYSFFPLTRPVAAKPKGNEKVTPLLITGNQFWAESDLKQTDLQFNPQTDIQGPFNLGFALSRPAQSTPKPEPSPSPSPSASASPSPSSSPAKPDDAKADKGGDDAKQEARLVVIGNSTFAIDGYFGQQLNGDLFLNSVSWLSKRDDQVLSIRPKETKNRRITMTPQQASLVGWTAVGVLPLLGFASAIYLWWKRR